MSGCFGENCALRCDHCGFCAHYFRCSWAAFIDSKFETCKHIHLVGRFRRSDLTEWRMVPSPEPIFPEVPEPDDTTTANDRECRIGTVKTRFLQIASRTSEVGKKKTHTYYHNKMRGIARAVHTVLENDDMLCYLERASAKIASQLKKVVTSEPLACNAVA